mmetsp:Transcript_31628/g.38711  ORF Transcript_31628/g.38711 Transcript_31628/m.38711 type:complete len:81 (-) Transcript_31628:141-383(-)
MRYVVRSARMHERLCERIWAGQVVAGENIGKWLERAGVLTSQSVGRVGDGDSKEETESSARQVGTIESKARFCETKTYRK